MILQILTSVRRHSIKFLIGTTRRVDSSRRLGYFDFPSSMRMGTPIVQFIVVSNSDWFVFVCNQNILSACPVHIDWSASGIFHMCDLILRPTSVAIYSLNSMHLDICMHCHNISKSDTSRINIYACRITVVNSVLTSQSTISLFICNFVA